MQIRCQWRSLSGMNVMMKRLLLFGRLLSLHMACVSAYQNVPTLKELCPYSSFCTSSPPKLIGSGEQIPCCLPCSCSDKCALTGNCCPGKAGEITSTPKHPCKRQDAIYSQLLNRTIGLRSSHYRVIDRCPDEIHNVSDAQELGSACYQANDIHDLTFVSDAETFDVYLNRFCAQCNGVENVVSWNLHVECRDNDVLRATSFQKRDQYILKYCSPSSLPPTDDIGIHSVCFQHAIKTCNESGEWDIYNPELEELCHKYDYGYTRTSMWLVLVYRNVYCYMCNSGGHSAPSDLCPPIEFGNQRLLNLDLVTLIFSQKDNPPTATDVTGCSETEVLDPFMVMLELNH